MNKKLIKQFVLLVFLAVIFVAQISAKDLPKFNNGDKVCFIGNSITHGGSYHTFLQLFCATRFPNEKIEFYNCGISGDVADGMINRFDDDIMIHKPDYAFLMTGMNDVNIRLYTKDKPDAETLDQRKKALDNYYIKTEKLTQMLIERNVQPIFLTPSIYDQTAKIEKENYFGANDALASCAIHIRTLAKKYNAPVIDFHEIMNTINQKVQIKDSTATIVGQDRVHPGDFGHLIMAYEIIKTIMPTEYVSELSINARRNKVILSENASIEMQNGNSDLEFKVLENAIPFPVKNDLAGVLDLVPLQDFNKEILSIKKLKKGNYKLLIDDVEVGTYSSKQLKSGVNLSKNSSTPQYKQAETVSDLCFDYRNVQSDLRTIAHVEYKMLGDYTGSDSLKEKKEFLDDKVESQKGKSWYGYMKKQCNEYFEILPKEDVFWEELDGIRESIYSSNKPEWHNYKLEKTNN